MVGLADCPDMTIDVYHGRYTIARTFNRYSGAPVAQWVKRRATDLAVLSSSPPQGENFSTVNGVSLHISFHYHPPIVLI